MKEILENDDPVLTAHRKYLDNQRQQVLSYDNPTLENQPYLSDPQIEFQFDKSLNELMGNMKLSMREINGGQEGQQGQDKKNIFVFLEKYPSFVAFYNSYVLPSINSNPLFKRKVYKGLDELAQNADILSKELSKRGYAGSDSELYAKLFNSVRNDALSRNLKFISPLEYKQGEQGVNIYAQPAQSGILQGDQQIPSPLEPQSARQFQDEEDPSELARREGIRQEGLQRLAEQEKRLKKEIESFDPNKMFDSIDRQHEFLQRLEDPRELRRYGRMLDDLKLRMEKRNRMLVNYLSETVGVGMDTEGARILREYIDRNAWHIDAVNALKRMYQEQMEGEERDAGEMGVDEILDESVRVPRPSMLERIDQFFDVKFPFLNDIEPEEREAVMEVAQRNPSRALQMIKGIASRIGARIPRINFKNDFRHLSQASRDLQDELGGLGEDTTTEEIIRAKPKGAIAESLGDYKPVESIPSKTFDDEDQYDTAEEEEVKEELEPVYDMDQVADGIRRYVEQVESVGLPTRAVQSVKSALSNVVKRLSSVPTSKLQEKALGTALNKVVKVIGGVLSSTTSLPRTGVSLLNKIADASKSFRDEINKGLKNIEKSRTEKKKNDEELDKDFDLTVKHLQSKTKSKSKPKPKAKEEEAKDAGADEKIEIAGVQPSRRGKGKKSSKKMKDLLKSIEAIKLSN